MATIQILDCTLRDGGYINDFQFGKIGIKKIIEQLTVAGIDIIETGFLEDGDYDEETSIYNHVEQIVPLLPVNRRKSMYVAMACYGEYNLSQLSDYDGTSVDGIRVTFHYDEVDEAIAYCRKIMQKGYKVFVQPVGTTSYTDEQLLELIKKVNALRPYSFYLVDTLGLMHQNDVLRFFYLIDHNLKSGIHMGFHSHNNLQLSYSNCQALAQLETNRCISMDASVYGMGRGAGNLNTELIANYLNIHKKANYEIEPLLQIVDEHILTIREKHEWGYSVSYYLAAVNGCHPNYASYLNGKQTLTIKGVSAILRMIEPNKRSLFNKELVEEKYLEYQSHEVDDIEARSVLEKILVNKNILILAPGPSLNDYKEKIASVVKDMSCVVISTNFVPDFIDTDYVFISSRKRYKTTFNASEKKVNLIHTSNIDAQEDGALVVNYSSLLNEQEVIRDNTAVMLLNLILPMKPNIIYLAGMDGYKVGGNYYADKLSLQQDDEFKRAINEAMTKKLFDLRQDASIEFVTPSLYRV